MFHALLLASLVTFAGAASAATGDQPAPPPAAPAQVIVVGVFHLANPGQDIFNVQVDDVLADKRQAEIVRLVDGLARFEPTAVMVEQPAANTDERYADFRAGALAPSRNEAVQLGFRLAALRGLERVHGIDVSGEFPFEPVQAFARTHGRSAQLDAALGSAGQEVQDLSRRVAEGSIGSVLRHMNTPGRLQDNHGFYVDMLRYGAGDEQPGAGLLSAWYARNLQICARLLQALPAGGRAVVIYGEAHAHLLRQCVVEAPGVELVEALDYLLD
jgi:hypothetical protein